MAFPGKLALTILVIAMVSVAVLTWGSIGSAVMIYGLILMGAALLYRRFLNRDDPDVYE